MDAETETESESGKRNPGPPERGAMLRGRMDTTIPDTHTGMTTWGVAMRFRGWAFVEERCQPTGAMGDVPNRMIRQSGLNGGGGCRTNGPDCG